VQEGWLIRRGEVLASARHPSGFAAHAVGRGQFVDGVGAVIVDGPAVVIGVALARVDRSGRLSQVRQPGGVHVVGPGRHAIAVDRAVASQLHCDDEVEFRAAT
jgi:hypothetical protein